MNTIGDTNNIGKENVRPIGIGSVSCPGHSSQASLTTSTMQSPIHPKRSSPRVFFSISPIDQDFSKRLLTRDNLPLWAWASPFSSVLGDPAGPNNSMKPTRRFVPPLSKSKLALRGSSWSSDSSQIYSQIPIGASIR